MLLISQTVDEQLVENYNKYYNNTFKIQRLPAWPPCSSAGMDDYLKRFKKSKICNELY